MASPGDSPSNKLKVGIGVRARSTEDLYVNSKYGGLTFNLIGEARANSVLSANIDILTINSSGAYSSLYTGEGRPLSAIFLNEASVNIAATSFLDFRVGVLNTEFSTITSTFEGQGFLGYRATLYKEGDSLRGELFGSQTVPASDTAEVKTSENGINTTLDLAGFSLSTNPKDKGAFTAKFSATAFEFKDLTSSAATDSRYFGNSVVDLGPVAKFKYNFKGYETAASMKAKFSDTWTSEAMGSYMINQSAPEGLNKGFKYSINVTKEYRQVKYTPLFGYFYNEPDTVPAVYASWNMANANRFGRYFGFNAELLKSKSKIMARWYQANEIEDKSYMADRNIVTLSAEITYDIL